ncbi:MAG: acyl-ACP thioesterase domain-containing protein [Streptosporangiaceae bacterium]
MTGILMFDDRQGLAGHGRRAGLCARRSQCWYGNLPGAPGRAPGAGAGAWFMSCPARGRVYATSRTVRAADVTPAGRLRLDAFARYLQEAAEDDVADTGWQAPYDWLARRCMVSARGYPLLGDRVTLRTFCTGTGPRWAERTTTLADPAGELMQATAVWVAIGRNGEPARLGPGFHRLYGEAAGGRRVSARLTLPAPSPAAAGRPWPVRASDFDPAGHVNNTVHWQAAEDLLAGLEWLPAAAELEYHQPILPGGNPQLLVSHAPDRVLFWLVNDRGRLASGRLARMPLAAG